MVVWLTGLSRFLQGPILISICGCDVIFLMRMLCRPAGMVCFPILNIWAMEYLLNFCFCFDCSTSSKDLVVYRVCKDCRTTNANLLGQSQQTNITQSESETKIGNLIQERGETRIVASDWSEKQYAFSDWLMHDTLK